MPIRKIRDVRGTCYLCKAEEKDAIQAQIDANMAAVKANDERREELENGLKKQKIDNNN